MTKLIEMCANLVRKGLKTIEDVPARLKKDVQALIKTKESEG